MNAAELHEIGEAVHALNVALQRAGLTGRGHLCEVVLGLSRTSEPWSQRVGLVHEVGQAMGVRIRTTGVESEAERFRRVAEEAQEKRQQMLDSYDLPSLFRDSCERIQKDTRHRMEVLGVPRWMLETGVPRGLSQPWHELLTSEVEQDTSIPQADPVKDELVRSLSDPVERKMFEGLAASFTAPSGPNDRIATPHPVPDKNGRCFERRMCPKCKGSWPLSSGSCDLCAATGYVYADNFTGAVMCPINENPSGREPDHRHFFVETEPTDPYVHADNFARPENNGKHVAAPTKKCDECGGSGTYESPLTGKRSPCSRGCKK